MKNLLTVFLLIVSKVTFGQIVKPLSTFYTDEQPSSTADVVNPFYYKDINNNFTPFLGTWISQIGNNTFVVNFWKETQKPIRNDNGGILYYSDKIFGHYKLVQNFGTSNEVTIYTSQINYLNSSTQIPTAVYAKSITSGKLEGTIYDVNTMTSEKYWGVRGSLVIIITGNSPVTATWTVSNSEEINPGTFVIPTNITLTKQ